MGLGYHDIRAGDLVVILRGGAIPFILRKDANGYHLIGNAYVHGIMQGEAVEEWRSRNTPEEVFPIR
ncbi:hypothetical protein GQ44DRAFT_705619 [Phaeosphaeriaceae sp. PMI808]|nr:hypothetical protein GQ44DRAFT_705619 [Phaeosphaeriaceae sp. PMI808]